MKGLIIILLPTLLAGCSYNEARVGNHGDSVYAIMRQQIADPQRAASPGTSASASGIDGAQMEGVLQGYRSNRGEARDVAQPIQINVGK